MLTLLCALPALAQPSPLHLEARPFAEGLIREGQWASARYAVDAKIPGLMGNIRIDELDLGAGSHTVFRRPLELPANTRREGTLYWRPGNGMIQRDMTYDSFLSATAPFQVQAIRAGDVAIGVIGNDRLGISALSEASAVPTVGRFPRPTDTRKVWTVPLEAATLPDQSLGYQVLDWIVWPHPDPRALPPGALEALLGWVADGGHLVVAPSEGWRQISGSPLDQAVPAEILGVEDREWGVANGWWSGSPSPVPALILQPAPGSWTYPDHPAVIAPYGVGAIHLLPVDPSRAPLAGHLSEDFWRTTLWLPRPEASQAMASPPALARQMEISKDYAPHLGSTTWRSALRAWLEDIPGVNPLPLPVLAGFALIYLVVIGPVDWLLTRKKPILTWITFPLWVTLFSAAALGGTYWMKGDQAVVRRLEIIEATPARWAGSSYLGVFAARKSEITLTSGFLDSAAAPLVEDAGFLNAPVLEIGDGPARLQWSAETWTLAKVMTTWSIPSRGSATLAWDGERGELRSTLPFDLTDVSVVLDEGTFQCDQLAAGGLWRFDRSEVVPLSDDPLDFPSHGRSAVSGARLVGTAPSPVEPLTLTGLSPKSTALTRVVVPLLPERAQP